MIVVICFFFFKQKTAYEIGTGDWSSDVALPIYFKKKMCNALHFSTPYISKKSPIVTKTKKVPLGRDRKSVV